MIRAEINETPCGYRVYYPLNEDESVYGIYMNTETVANLMIIPRQLYLFNNLQELTLSGNKLY